MDMEGKVNKEQVQLIWTITKAGRDGEHWEFEVRTAHREMSS